MNAIFVQCPCCQKDRNLVATPLLKAAQEIVKQGCAPWHWRGDAKVVIELAKRKELQWAYNACLKSKRAISALPSKQNYMDGNPFFAYFDMRKTCQQCGNTFTFSAEEQQFWYETLKFLVFSNPIACPACRRENREKKKSIMALQEAIENLNEQDPESLLELAERFQHVGNEEKALLYFRRAKNLERKGEKAESLFENIELNILGGEQTHG